MNTKEAASYIRKSASWLNKSRMSGTGPVFVRNGGTVLYFQSDLDAWLNSGRRTAIYDFCNDNERARAVA
jgi:hypothetical protein